MLSPQDCYAPLKTKSKNLFQLLNLLEGTPVPWQKHFGFDCIELDIAWRDQEPALFEVHKIFPIKKLGVLKIPPFNFYDWHVDKYRLSCINMLLNVKHSSHSLFGRQIDDHNKDITELRYQPKTFYLFNNQIEHSVTNLWGDRFLFSLYFENETPFEDVKNGLQEANLI